MQCFINLFQNLTRLMNKLFILLFLLCTFAAEDYYQILGIKRNANEQDIKKAFKKLSLKYHPDKNKGNEEQAQKKFQKVVNAYETLKDPEKRKIYDQYGEEGVNQHAQREQHQGGAGDFGNFHFNFGGGGGGFEDIFSQFFGRGDFRQGGQQGFNNQQQFHQQQEPEKAASIFENTDVYVLEMAGLSRFFRREEVWFIYFFENNEAGKKQKSVVTELAEKYAGIFRVAAIDCSEEEALCEDEFQVFKTPQALVYPARINADPQKHQGSWELNDLAKLPISLMEDFVIVLSGFNFQEFIQKSKPKAMLFTNKKSTPPLFKALSKEFKGKLEFGMVRHSETALNGIFKVSAYPTLIVAHSDEDYKVYEGELLKDQIVKFFRQFAYGKEKNPKKKEGKILPLEGKTADDCLTKGKDLCFILVVQDEGSLRFLQNAQQKYQNDKLVFTYSRQGSPLLKQFFAETNMRLHGFMVKPKRKTYSYLADIKNDQDIYNFVDEVLGGGRQFKAFQKEDL